MIADMDWEEIAVAIQKAIDLCRADSEQEHDYKYGVIECPVCRNLLHYKISRYNGHCHGRCSTKGCLNWME